MLMEEIKAHEKTDRELQKAKELAEAANQAKSRYLTGLSHELRSPLNAAFGYAQLLEQDPTIPENRRDAVGAIRRSTEHLSDLIEGLLEISKIEAGRLELYRNQVCVPELIDELVTMFQLQAAEKGIGFEFRSKTPIPGWVTADEKRLRQVLINLLSNAIKFTREGQVTLTFRYRNQVAEFTISDTGVGIDEEDLQRIFRPFERVRKPGIPSVHGTGLGLTITKLLADIMGGDIQVSSTPGQGSEFRLSVMLSRLSGPAPTESKRTPVIGYTGARKSLLVVDDDPSHRGLISDLLTPLGFIINEAPDGETGMQLARHITPDLVLMDIAMPGMNGWETAQHIRRQGYRGPIVMLSGNARENQPDIPDGIHNDYLTKPFKLNALVDCLARQLGLTWLHQETPQAKRIPVTTETRTPLSPTLRDELLALAEIGHLSALRERLAQARQQKQVSASLADEMNTRLTQFDFQAVIRLLEEAA